MNRTRLPIVIVAVAFTLGVVLSITISQLQANDKAQTPLSEVTLNPSMVLPAEHLVTLSDSGYGYAFQVPSNWGPVEPDDDPGGRFTTYTSPMPNGTLPEPTEFFMGMRFAAHHASKYMPEPAVINRYIDERALATSQDILPYLPEGEIKTIGDYTIHIRTVRDLSVANEDLAPYGTSVYFLVEDVVYYFFITYTSPRDPKYMDIGWSTYNQVINTILYSFKVDKNAPYLTNRPQPVAPEVIQAQMEQLMQQGPQPPPPTSTPIQGYPHLD